MAQNTFLFQTALCGLCGPNFPLNEEAVLNSCPNPAEKIIFLAFTRLCLGRKISNRVDNRKRSAVYTSPAEKDSIY